MKLIFQKRVDDGKYYVNIFISEFTETEVDNIKKFGSPEISINPQKIYRRGLGLVEKLPIHDLSYDYQFNDAESAEEFIGEMTKRIKVAAIALKSQKDDFSGINEISL